MCLFLLHQLSSIRICGNPHATISHHINECCACQSLPRIYAYIYIYIFVVNHPHQFRHPTNRAISARGPESTEHEDLMLDFPFYSNNHFTRIPAMCGHHGNRNRTQFFWIGRFFDARHGDWIGRVRLGVELGRGVGRRGCHQRLSVLWMFFGVVFGAVI